MFKIKVEYLVLLLAFNLGSLFSQGVGDFFCEDKRVFFKQKGVVVAENQVDFMEEYYIIEVTTYKVECYTCTYRKGNVKKAKEFLQTHISPKPLPSTKS